MSNLIDYIRGVYRDRRKDTRLMMLPQDGTPLHISMIEYFARFRDDILQRAKQTCFDELTVFHLLSYMGKRDMRMGPGLCRPRRGWQQVQRVCWQQASHGRRSTLSSKDAWKCRREEPHCKIGKRLSWAIHMIVV